MSCELVERELDAFLDGELDAESSAAMRTHVNSCATCRREVARRDTLSSLVGCAPYYTAPDRLRERAGSQSASRSLGRVVQWIVSLLTCTG